MTHYPTLKEMGIHATETIKRFSLRHERDREVLKIHFHRQANALRSESQKFTFARPRQAIPGQSRHSQAFAELESSSPVLRSALAELKQLTAVAVQPLSPNQQHQAPVMADISQKIECLA
ncbi:DUF3461 family protein [Pseudomonas sp. EL_65y_Pfl2_R95]|uniref:DUF3461 family protein n=1 Tax=Pseudomonas sp. EL_65y_Pfl2_R95 TaxID=3088698 RepID=UPI0030D8A51B